MARRRRQKALKPLTIGCRSMQPDCEVDKESEKAPGKCGEKGMDVMPFTVVFGNESEPSGYGSGMTETHPPREGEMRFA